MPKSPVTAKIMKGPSQISIRKIIELTLAPDDGETVVPYGNSIIRVHVNYVWENQTQDDIGFAAELLWPEREDVTISHYNTFLKRGKIEFSAKRIREKNYD